MSLTDHMPKLTRPNIRTFQQKHDLSDRETVEEFVARGGKIQHIASGEALIKETGAKKSRQENLERLRHQDPHGIKRKRLLERIERESE